MVLQRKQWSGRKQFLIWLKRERGRKNKEKRREIPLHPSSLTVFSFRWKNQAGKQNWTILILPFLKFQARLTNFIWALPYDQIWIPVNFVLDPATKSWLEHHKHHVFGFPTLVRFSWGTCTPYFKDIVEVLWESDKTDEEGSSTGSSKRQLKLSSVGFTGVKRKSEEIESSGKGRCKFFHARKLEQVTHF